MKTLFDAEDTAPRATRKVNHGKVAARKIDKAISALMRTNPPVEHVGEILDCFARHIPTLEARMHDEIGLHQEDAS